MTISRVGSGISPLQEYAPKGSSVKNVKKSFADNNDKIEISKEGKVKSLESTETSKLSLVRERIDSGFYNKEGVLDRVVNSILKEMRGA
jgi:hypothetical protein